MHPDTITRSIKDKALGRSIGQLKVKDSLFDETLGGSFVTAVIADHIVKTSKVDVSGNRRALGKVMSQAEKVKFILSANKDSPISIEGLDGDYDYSGHAPPTNSSTTGTTSNIIFICFSSPPSATLSICNISS